MSEKTKDCIQKLVIIISIIIIAFFAYSITPKTFQNDTFYTIKIGEHIVQNTDKITDLLPWNKGLDMKDHFHGIKIYHIHIHIGYMMLQHMVYIILEDLKVYIILHVYYQ